MLQPVGRSCRPRLERRADLELRIGRDGAFARRARRLDQRRLFTIVSPCPLPYTVATISSISAMNAPRTRCAVSITSAWFERLRQHAGRHVGDARIPSTSMPTCLARWLRHGRHPDGVEAPIVRGEPDLGRRFVAGVRAGPRRCLCASERPFRPAARSATARKPLRVQLVMSGNRWPKRSSFAPPSGLVPTRLMWSSMTIRAPCENDVLIPAGRVGEDQRLHADRPHHSGWRTRRSPSGALRRSAPAPRGRPPSCPRTVPATSYRRGRSPLPAATRGCPRTASRPRRRRRWRNRRARASTIAIAGASGIRSRTKGGGRLHALEFAAHSRNPAIVAVMKLASVPASIARSPSRAGRAAGSARARRCRRSGCRWS